MGINEVKEYWENEAKKKKIPESINDLFQNYWTKRYVENLKYIKTGSRILDIGCGDSKYFIKLEDKFDEFYGIDLSEVHFENAKKLFPLGNYVVADANKLPFEDSFFETIISFGAFEHNESISNILKECYRVLDNHGILLFSVPNRISPYYPYLYLYTSIKKIDKISLIGHLYSKKDLKLEVLKAGFKNFKIVDSIYATPVPAHLGIELIKKLLKNKKVSNDGIKIHINDLNQNNLKKYLYYFNYFIDRLFYPFECLGFGFMRVVKCEK